MASQPVEPSAAGLFELETVPWRAMQSPRALARRARLWTTWTLVVATPFVVCGIVLLLLEPATAPVALASFAHAWGIPELYAARGARVVSPARSPGWAEQTARGLLGDLLDHTERKLARDTGLALHRGSFGVWLVGEGGALLIVPGARRVHCFCVRCTEADLPPSDRVAHLLLALRTDEVGFATVANHAFCGAPWRVRRRLWRRRRPALSEACRIARHDAH